MGSAIEQKAPRLSPKRVCPSPISHSPLFQLHGLMTLPTTPPGHFLLIFAVSSLQRLTALPAGRRGFAPRGALAAVPAGPHQRTSASRHPMALPHSSQLGADLGHLQHIWTALGQRGHVNKFTAFLGHFRFWFFCPLSWRLLAIPGLKASRAISL